MSYPIQDELFSQQTDGQESPVHWHSVHHLGRLLAKQPEVN